MHPRTRALIDELQLLPHPEGGCYRESCRSSARVVPSDGRGSQAARPLGDYALTGCTVGPGFGFAAFSFLRDRPGLSAHLPGPAADLQSLL